MAMDLGSKGSLKADINVTPLVDVMLVLLIIMMLIAPMLQQGVAVTLPEAGNTGDKPDTQDQTVVAIDSRGKFYVNALPTPTEDLDEEGPAVGIGAGAARRLARGVGRLGLGVHGG